MYIESGKGGRNTLATRQFIDSFVGFLKFLEALGQSLPEDKHGQYGKIIR